MILLRALEVQDFKSLRQVALCFEPRCVVLIEGLNESGKSTLFEAVYFALYGEPLVTAGQRGSYDDAIRYGADEAQVRLTLTVDGTELQITRVLRRGRPNRAELAVLRPGEPPEKVRGPVAVRARLLAELRGLDGDALRNSCFVEQKKLARLEELSRAERQRSFERLLNLEALGLAAESLKLSPDDPELRLARARLELARVRTAIPRVEAELAEVERALGAPAFGPEPPEPAEPLADPAPAEARSETPGAPAGAAERTQPDLPQRPARLSPASLPHPLSRPAGEGVRVALLGGLAVALLLAGAFALGAGLAPVGAGLLALGALVGLLAARAGPASAPAEREAPAAPPSAPPPVPKPLAVGPDPALGHPERLPGRSGSELLARRDRLLQELGALGAELRRLEGAHPGLAGAELDERACAAELAALERDRAVRRLALELIEETRRRTLERVLPRTEQNLCLLLPQLTAGRYHDARLSADYQLEVWDEVAQRYVAKDLCSGGARDQLSLALRLAFALATLPQERGAAPGFLFLDEPLSAFDARRAAALVELVTRGEIARHFPQVFVISHRHAFDPAVFPHRIRLADGAIVETTLGAAGAGGPALRGQGRS